MASLCLSAASSDTPIEIRLEKEASAESITMRDGRTDTKDKSKVEIRDERTNSFVQEKKKKGAKSQFHPPPPFRLFLTTRQELFAARIAAEGGKDSLRRHSITVLLLDRIGDPA